MLFYSGVMTLLTFIMIGICSILNDKLKYQKDLLNGLRASRDRYMQREFTANAKAIKYNNKLTEINKTNSFGAETVEKLQCKIKEILEND